jgi:serine/threonine-protein kinase
LIPPDHVNTKLSTGVGEVVEVMMAKDRGRRYASTSDLLMDLEAIAAGQPPLQARKTINKEVLSGLAESDLDVESPEGAAVVPTVGGWNCTVLMILLIGALAASVILNLVLLALRWKW